MKKIILSLIIIFFVFVTFMALSDDSNKQYTEAINAVSAELEANPVLYPYYKKLSASDRDSYAKIYAAARDMSANQIQVYTAESEREIDDYIDRLMYIYREIVYENPGFFWLDPYKLNTTISKTGTGEYILQIQLNYLFTTEQVEQMKPKFEQKIKDIVSLAKAEQNTFDQVLFVHDYIVSNCVYDEETYNNEDFTNSSINAYGCLIDGKAICSGYTMAFNAIMKQLGYETGVEFNTYDKLSIFDEGHVWNYCNLDGEYYYFDLTWDDIAPDSDMYESTEYYHSYFAITEDELELSHLTLSDKAMTPDCNGTKYNYFIYNNLNFSEYNYNEVKSAILAQEEQEYIQLRFDTYSELLKAESDLITNQKIFKILPDLESCQYYISKSKLQLYILL